MSTSLPLGPVQDAVLDFAVNNFLLSSLLLGMYSVIYFGTVCICSSQKSQQHKIVTGTISLSYFVYLVDASVQWYNVKQAFVNNGDTRESIFVALYRNPTEWAFFIRDICYFFLAALADGLLIWRCFNVWNRSFYAILLPSFLLFCETGIGLSLIAVACATHLRSSTGPDRILDELFAVGTFVTLATTLSATLLISYRIHSFSKHGLPSNSRARLKHIVEILAQSAAVYSVVTFASAIASVIPFTDSNTAPLTTAQGYTATFYLFTAGVAPTIMVARVVITSDGYRGNSVVTRMSSLQFHSRPTLPDATPFRRDSILA